MVKVDAKGRIVLPKELWERLGIAPGTEVDVHAEEGRVVVEPEDDPERILDRIERLVTETGAAARTASGEGGTHPIAHRHREAVRRGAERDSDA